MNHPDIRQTNLSSAYGIERIINDLRQIAQFCIQANIMQCDDIPVFHERLYPFLPAVNGQQWGGYPHSQYGHNGQISGSNWSGYNPQLTEFLQALRTIVDSGQQHLLGEAARSIVATAFDLLERNGISFNQSKVINNG